MEKIDSVQGFRFGSVAAGIKRLPADRDDFALIVADNPSNCAGVTTTNLVAAAPVQITRECLSRGVCQAILVNSGNANAYTGEKGIADATALNQKAADRLGISPDLVIPMSTGVIGNPLPVDRMSDRIPELLASLDYSKHMDVARAIMTTDTVPKTIFLQGEAAEGEFRMLGMAKGAGMIAPNMATMLGVILTDVAVELDFLRESVAMAARNSFNSITIDGDTSTNDTLVVVAGGRDNAPAVSSRSDRKVFRAMLDEACMSLARQIVRDGEGATKVVEVHVCGAPDDAGARKVARAIAESPLVKTAFHGEDPNWGRILCSAGYAGVLFDPQRVDLFIGDVSIVRDGKLFSGEWESAAHNVMKSKEFAILLDLKSGKCEATILTSDFSEEYVTINADYRS
jgi:glutamate N-acetyltransferase / amino-acid N-acetyltransferase